MTYQPETGPRERQWIRLVVAIVAGLFVGSGVFLLAAVCPDCIGDMPILKIVHGSR